MSDDDLLIAVGIDPCDLTPAQRAAVLVAIELNGLPSRDPSGHPWLSWSLGHPISIEVDGDLDLPYLQLLLDVGRALNATTPSL